MEPGARAARVQAARGDADAIAALLQPGSCRPDLIDGARALRARADPELGGLALSALLHSKLGRIENDEDIQEPLVDALLALSPQELARAVRALPHAELGPALRANLDARWLEPLGGSSGALGAERLTDLDAALGDFAAQWLLEALDDPARRQRLSAVDGDVLFSLVTSLEAAALLAIAAVAEGDARAAAEEALRQQQPPAAVLARARRVLGWTGQPSARGAIEGAGPPPGGGEPPTAAPSPAPPLAYGSWRSFGPVYPRAVAAVDPFAGSPLLAPDPAAWRPPGLRLLGGVALAFWLLWLAALRRWPAGRPALHRAGAVALVPTGLLALEALLGLAGVRVLADLRPTFDPGRSPEHVFVPLDGEPAGWAQTASSAARYAAFPRTPAPCTARVVALGASSVHGSGHEAEHAWPARLGGELGGRLRGWRVEVLNAGLGGATSDGIRLYAAEALALGADLLVVSVGANDLNHSPDLASYRGFAPETLALRHRLDRWRIVRLLSGPVERLRPPPRFTDAHQDPLPPTPEERADLLRLAAANLESNLLALTERATAAGVPTVLLLQGQNEAICGPDSAGGVVGSRGCFPPSLRATYAAVSAATGAPVVDSASALRARNGGGAIGHEAYFDAIHPTRWGHRVLAAATAPAAAEALGPRLGRRDPEARCTPAR